MRLWHYKLLKYLPKKQLVSQWRELIVAMDSDYRSILIKHVDTNPKSHLKAYADLLIEELKNRGIRLKTDPYNKYLKFASTIKEGCSIKEIFPDHDNDRYLRQCFYNLQEKYDGGQKDFTKEVYDKLYTFVNEEIGGGLNY